MLQKGEEIGAHDLSLAEPTFTHMALAELHKRKMLKHVVSQNCDGLHLRSGLPRFSLSEVHGNMYVEVCKHCKPAQEYWRLFDTTPLTSRFQHKTNRRCRICANPLVDTIVHFGERGSLKWPLNWNGATKAVKEADVILCLGSSLKVLKKYPWLWALDQPLKQRPKVYIVNLQWTPKDSIASIKIHGKCDEVMKIVMKQMEIEVPMYDRLKDPIFHHTSILKDEELHTTSQPMLRKDIFKQEDESCESNTRTTFSSEKQTESSDQENVRNFCVVNQTTKSTNGIKEEIQIKREHEDDDKNDEENNFKKIKIEKSEENGKKEPENDEKNSKKNDEILDLTIDDDDDEEVNEKQQVKRNGNQSVDFEELIENFEVKPASKIEENVSKNEETKPILNSESINDKCPETPNNNKQSNNHNKLSPEIILQQNQNLIDMALLNNQILTASLAMSPGTSATPEALTATALILNYNNQIINTLSNNLNLLPYDGSSSTTSSLENNNKKINKTNCDKIISKSVLENDIEMVESSTGEEESQDNNINNSEQYYKNLLASYCKAINDNLPNWSDVRYAYSGLHTIVNLPPENANLWKNNGEKRKLRTSTAVERRAAKAECKFCYDSYEQMECQFYRPVNREFKIAAYRNGKMIVCECCDVTDNEEELNSNNDDDNNKINNDEKDKVVRAGWFGKGKSHII